MKVEIINDEKADSLLRPTEFCQLEEIKQCHEDGEHYGSEWFAEVDDLGKFLTQLQAHEKDYIGFFVNHVGRVVIWIGVEDAPWG